MIRAEHVRDEVRTAETVVKDPKATVQDKLSAIFKVITVLVKVTLSVRTNTKLIMKKVDAKPLPSRRKEGRTAEKADVVLEKTE